MPLAVSGPPELPVPEAGLAESSSHAVLGPRRSSPLGARCIVQAESLLTWWPGPAGKSHCPRLEGGAILPPEDMQASAPLSFILKIDFQPSFQSEDLWFQSGKVRACGS